MVYIIIKPYEHYIPIKEDLSDLIEKILCGAQQNDDKCKIAYTSYNLAINELTLDKALKYMAYTLNKNINKIDN